MTRSPAPGRRPHQPAEHAVQLVGLPELLAQSDVVTVHVLLSPETRGLIGRAQVETMKPGAILLNVARGGLVDEDALAEALREGRLAGDRKSTRLNSSHSQIS